MSKIYKKKEFIAVIIVSLTALITGTLYSIVCNAYEKRYVQREVSNITTEMRENNALLSIHFQDGEGYMILNNNGEAYLEKDGSNGTISERVFLKNGNTVELVDGMPTEKCLAPIDIIKTIVMENEKASYNKLRGSKVTGSNNDKRKDAFMVTVSGSNECINILNKCVSNAAQILVAYGATENSNVSLVISGYRGISSYTDGNKTDRNIINDDLAGYGTLVMDLVIDGKAYIIYSMTTIATSDKGMRLGSEIYKCNVGEKVSTEQSYDIALDIWENLSESLEYSELGQN